MHFSRYTKLLVVGLLYSSAALAQVTMDDVIRGAVTQPQDERTEQQKRMDDLDSMTGDQRLPNTDSGNRYPPGGFTTPPASTDMGGSGGNCGPARDDMCGGFPPQAGSQCQCCSGPMGVPSCSWGRGSTPGAVTHRTCVITSGLGTPQSCRSSDNYFVVQRIKEEAANYRDYETRAARAGANDTIQRIEFEVTCQPAYSDEVVAGPFRYDGRTSRYNHEAQVQNEMHRVRNSCCTAIGSNPDRCFDNPLR